MTNDRRSRRKALTDLPIVRAIGSVVWRWCHAAVRPLRLRQQTSRGGPIRVMIGSGSMSVPGWITTDLMPRGGSIYLNATKPWPFENASVARIHCEHMIEHITFEQAQSMLVECFRVLEPGGRIRIATPDFDTFVKLGCDREIGLDEVQAKYVHTSNTRNSGVPALQLDNPVFAVNRMFSGHGHRFLYTPDLLFDCLTRTGFVECQEWDVGESDDPDFRGSELHGLAIDEESNRFQTLVVEAKRPDRGA
jgi:hypothetical protein